MSTQDRKEKGLARLTKSELKIFNIAEKRGKGEIERVIQDAHIKDGQIETSNGFAFVRRPLELGHGFDGEFLLKREGLRLLQAGILDKIPLKELPEGVVVSAEDSPHPYPSIERIRAKYHGVEPLAIVGLSLALLSQVIKALDEEAKGGRWAGYDNKALLLIRGPADPVEIVLPDNRGDAMIMPINIVGWPETERILKSRGLTSKSITQESEEEDE